MYNATDTSFVSTTDPAYYQYMDQVLVEIISQFGVLGILLIGIGWLIYSDLKARRDGKKDSSVRASEIDRVLDRLDRQDARMDRLEAELDEKIDGIRELVHVQPQRILQNIVDKEAEEKRSHSKEFIEQVQLAPKIHALLGKYKSLINYDHIFLASFHNGTSSMTGIPYFKYDMIAERYSPEIPEDTEMASMYQNVDLMRHGRLPSALLQAQQLIFRVDPGSIMEDADPMMYRRCIGRGIRQIGFQMINDQAGNPSGFLCILKYSDDQMNMAELKNCASLIESLYNTAAIKQEFAPGA